MYKQKTHLTIVQLYSNLYMKGSERMSDLISRSALIESLVNSGVADSAEDGWVHSFVLSLIEHQPTVEAKPVVHCKDCDMLQDCKFGQYLGLEGYCSRGEKHD